MPIHSSRVIHSRLVDGATRFYTRIGIPFTMSEDNPLELSNNVDLLQNRARMIAAQSLQSTRRMVALVDESKEVGLRTVVMMDEQGEKLDYIEAANREIHEDIRQSERALTEMDKCCGLFILPWKRPKMSRSERQVWKKSSEDMVVNDQPRPVTDHTGDTFVDGFVPRITKDSCEEEMGTNLAHVHSTVGNLKNMAADIRAAAYDHTRTLDKIIQQADNNDQHVVVAAQRTDKLHK